MSLISLGRKPRCSCRDCKGKPRHAAHSRSPALRPAHPSRAGASTGTRQGACTFLYLPARISTRWSIICLDCVWHGMWDVPTPSRPGHKHQDDTHCVVITRELLHPHTATGTACKQHAAQSLQNPPSPAQEPLPLLFLIFFKIKAIKPNVLKAYSSHSREFC